MVFRFIWHIFGFSVSFIGISPSHKCLWKLQQPASHLLQPRPLSPFLRRRQTRSNKHSQPASLYNDNRFSFPSFEFNVVKQEVLLKVTNLPHICDSIILSVCYKNHSFRCSWFWQKHEVENCKCIQIAAGGNGQIVPDARRPRPCSCYQLFTYGGKLVLRGSSIVWGWGWELLTRVF